MEPRFLEVVTKNSRVRPWQLQCQPSLAFPDALEHHAGKLLNELVFHIAQLRIGKHSDPLVQRGDIEAIVEQIHAARVTTIHGAIIWCYRDIEAFLR